MGWVFKHALDILDERWKAIKENFDAFAHACARLGILLDVLDSLKQAIIDALGVVEEIGRKLFEAFEIILEYLFADRWIDACRHSFQFLKIKFRLFGMFFHARPHCNLFRLDAIAIAAVACMSVCATLSSPWQTRDRTQ